MDWPVSRLGLGLGVGLGLGLGLGLGGGGLLPTTSHSILYSRAGRIAMFSHCEPLDWENTRQEQPFFPIPRFHHRARSGCAIGFWVRLKWFSP